MRWMRIIEIVFNHLIGDLNLKMPSSVYSCGWSTDGVGVVAFKDSFVTCCTLLLLSLYTCRFIVTLFLLSPMLSGCVASRTVTAWTWFILTTSLSCLQILALKVYFFGFNSIEWRKIFLNIHEETQNKTKVFRM